MARGPILSGARGPDTMREGGRAKRQHADSTPTLLYVDKYMKKNYMKKFEKKNI